MSSAQTHDSRLASRGRRLAATLIDAVLVPSLTIVLIMITDIVEDADDYLNNMWMLWVLLLAISSYLLLNGYLLWRNGQTLGKRLLGIAIVSTDSDNAVSAAPIWKLICIRALFFPLLFALLPPFILLALIDQLFIFSKSRRCLHDLASGTIVIRLGEL
jgi:uncharacterized RDD family membrane protein YckC